MTHVLFGPTWTCPVPLDNRWIELNSPVEFLGINYECFPSPCGCRAAYRTQRRHSGEETAQKRSSNTCKFTQASSTTLGRHCSPLDFHMFHLEMGSGHALSDTKSNASVFNWNTIALRCCVRFCCTTM